MADFGIAEIALIAGGLASAAAGAGGQIFAADSERRASNYNADVMDQEAFAAKDKAKAEEDAHRESVKRILSTQRALFAKSGVDMSGSPLLVMEDTARQGELDALTIRYGGDVAAARARSQANLMRMQGADKMTAGYIGAGTTLLTGATQMGMSFYKGGKK